MTTFAVIGHGRSPEGKGWAEKIDACVTIRMWDWHWQAPADYGTRYDYGLLEAAPSLMRTFNAHNQRQPAKGWVVSALHQARYCTLPPRSELIDQAPWSELGKHMGGLGATGRLQFTRGTIATCWTAERLAEPGDMIVLVGFDNVTAGKQLPIDEAFAPEYRKNPGSYPFAGYQSGAVKTGNHDFAIERPLMQHVAACRGVALAFAGPEWPC